MNKMNDRELAEEIENRRQVNSEEFLGRFLRKHSDQIIAALRRSQPEGMVMVPRSFIEGLEFGTWRRTETREGEMCPSCYRFEREGHKEDCVWSKKIRAMLSAIEDKKP